MSLLGVLPLLGLGCPRCPLKGEARRIARLRHLCSRKHELAGQALSLSKAKNGIEISSLTEIPAFVLVSLSKALPAYPKRHITALQNIRAMGLPPEGPPDARHREPTVGRELLGNDGDGQLAVDHLSHGPGRGAPSSVS